MTDLAATLKKLNESSNFEFTVDTSKTKLVEAKDERTGETIKRMVVEGIMSVASAITGNKRRYGLPIWEKQLAEGSDFRKRLVARKVVGMLEHPKEDPDYDRVSHLFEDVKLLADGKIWARVTIMKTPKGAILEELFNLGVPVGASSRGEGSTSLAEDEIEDVDDDYVLETWDFVHTPALDEARARKVESLQDRKGTEPMNEALTKAKAFLEEHKGGVSGVATGKLVEAHLRAVEHLTTLAGAKEPEAAEVRGGIATVASQIAARMTEESKTEGDKLKEGFNAQFPTSVEAITALVETLVGKNADLQAQITEAKDAKPEDVAKLKEQLEKVTAERDAAFRVGEDLVKKVRRSVKERQKLERKYAASLALHEKIITAIRDRDLKEKVEAVIGKLPQLSKVRDDLLASKTMPELQEKLAKFCALIGVDLKETEKPGKKPAKSKKESKTSGAPREPMPSKDTRKGTRVVEDAPTSGPTSLFGKIAQKEALSRRPNRAAEHKRKLDEKKQGIRSGK
jgi:hypothetical protein